MKVKKARWLVVLVVVAMMLAMVPAVGLALSPQYTLFAGQENRVGNVKVWDDADHLYLEIKIDTGDWYISESHVHVGKELSDFPRAGRWGNPIPGLFDSKTEYDRSEEERIAEHKISRGDWEKGEDLKIAVHVVVERKDCVWVPISCHCGYWVCEYEDDTAWAAECGADFPPPNTMTRFTSRGNWATYITYTLKTTLNGNIICVSNDNSGCEGNETSGCEGGSDEGAGSSGMPAAHGVSGRDFGGAVADWAQDDPGALAAHARGR